MRISSKLLRKIIASLISKALRSKLGVDAEIQFNDEIKVSMNEDDMFIHLNVDIMCKNNEVIKLLNF